MEGGLAYSLRRLLFKQELFLKQSSPLANSCKYVYKKYRRINEIVVSVMILLKPE